jgi:threonyl-tRNA synthetase
MSKIQDELKNDPLMPLRHSAEHLLHMSVEALFPGAKKVMGPPIEGGFYGDFDSETKIAQEDFEKIEKRMREIIKANLPVEMSEVTPEKAKEIFKDNKYKLEMVRDIEEKGEKIGVCEIGEKGNEIYDVDLCAGPHVEKTGDIDPEAFKLLSIAGAYWRGDEKNKMLTRIYSTAFNTKENMEKYLEKLEEAKSRDHRKLGKELDLFTFSELVGPGLPLYTPKGTVIKEELQKHIETISKRYGYQKVMTPHLAKIKLYELSGHADKFDLGLFRVTSDRKHDFVMKPVQCPHQTQIYASRPRSYKDLPIRYMESEKQYRAEKSGEVGGLNRVYAITIEDAHSFCTVDQVKSEVKDLVNVVQEFYEPLGLWENRWVSLSVKDPKDMSKYIGEEKDWVECEKILEEVANETKLDAKRMEGEAALYGPKLDFMFKDALGNDVQIPTIQLDFATPKRFDLEYTNEKGEKETPVMVHRAILGSYERMIALLIEHFAGAFPVWLAPVQVGIIPISDDQVEYAQKIEKELQKKELRVEINTKNASMGAKIREAQLAKIPYMLIVGKKEQEENSVSVRLRDGKDLGTMKPDDFAKKAQEVYLTRGLNLW